MPVSCCRLARGAAGRLLVVVLVCLASSLDARAGDLPERLSDEAFWALSTRLSEPDGVFRSDTLSSNELHYPDVLDRLTAAVPPGGVYLGVGPEQNFSYIAAVRPQVAFITDVRRGNLHVHLMYKAIFELSADRLEFLSRLFTKPRPPGLTPDSPIADIMTAFGTTETSTRQVFDSNLREILAHLTVTRELPLESRDLDAIADVYASFYWFGPAISYASTSSDSGRRNRMPEYDALMTATDSLGVPRSYLASASAFAVVKDLHARNLIVPVVGDFGGPHALRAVGDWVRERDAVVSVFYLSNVEQYLRQQGTWTAFCGNVASLPLAPWGRFVRSQAGGGGFRMRVDDIAADVAACAAASERDGLPSGAPARP